MTPITGLSLEPTMSKPTDSAKTPAIQLTTGAGNPIADNQNSLGAGRAGPCCCRTIS
jgi:hypothetical protein